MSVILPKLALVYLPLLLDVQSHAWPDLSNPAYLAAKVEQETCRSLTHSMCWNPHAELRTSREYGFGLGQLTIAYRADGSTRFNKQAELIAQHASLKGWSYATRYEPRMQLTAVVELNHDIYRHMRKLAANEEAALHFTSSAYNGGEGGVLQDRMLCRNTAGCNPALWFGNVEKTSTKSRVKFKGYGQSPFDINRTYVFNIFKVRIEKYLVWMRERAEASR